MAVISSSSLASGARPILGLKEAEKSALVSRLVDARRAVKKAMASGDMDELQAGRKAVDQAKIALGERGPVWWTDGSPDLNRKHVKNTPYADWFSKIKPA